jgi:hypothetical protein
MQFPSAEQHNKVGSVVDSLIPMAQHLSTFLREYDCGLGAVDKNETEC